MTTVLFWDIDGTLLTTKKAGITAWNSAVREVLGREVDLETLPTAGRTDRAIARLIAEKLGGPTDDATCAALLRAYEQNLPSALPTRTGHAIEQAEAILEYLRDRDDFLSILLTGNTSAGAGAKLGHFGLDGYFAHGAFSDTYEDRDEIAREAHRVACYVLGTALAPEDSFVIGDTPHDITCARAIGARCVAVGTGQYSAEDLAEYEPWVSLEKLPDPEEFVSLLRGGE